MKKTLLLTALLASASAFAGTHGTVELSNATELKLTKKGELTKEFALLKDTPKVSAEVAVEGTGFSFGGEYFLKEMKPFIGDLSLKSIESASRGNIHAKYVLPEIKGVKSYVKGTFNNDKELTAEVDAKYDYNGYTIGFNSTTTIPLFNKISNYTTGAKYEDGDDTELRKKIEKINGLKDSDVSLDIKEIALEMGIADKLTAVKTEKEMQAKDDVLNNLVTVKTPLTETESTHTLSVEKKELGMFKDLKASVAVTHAWGNTYALINKASKKPLSIADVKAVTEFETVSNRDAFKSVEVKLEGQYKEIKDLNLKGEAAVKYIHNAGEGMEFLGGEKVYSNTNAVKDTYKLTAEYKGFKNLTLTGMAFINHMGDVKYFGAENAKSKLHNVEYGIDAKAEYKAMENLTLTGNAIFAGQSTVKQFEKANQNNKTKEVFNQAYVKLAAGAKYDYKATDKFVVTPEFNASFEAKKIANYPTTEDGKTVLLSEKTVMLTPKVSANYTISDSLTLGGSIEAGVKFNGVKEVKYSNTTIKSNLNLKYTW